MSEKNVLFVSLGSLGDVLPLLSLAVTLGIGPALFGPIVQTREKVAQRQAELNDLSKIALQLSPDIIVFSTFCTEAWHLGEKLDVPVIAVTLFPLDTGRDTDEDGIDKSINSLHSELRKHVPELLEELQKDIPTKVSWTDVEIWMSRLFSEEHGAFRDQLNLSPLIFLDDKGNVCLPKKTPVLLAYEASLVPKALPKVVEDENYIQSGFWPCVSADYATTVRVADKLLHVQPQASGGTIPLQNTLINLAAAIDAARSDGKNLVYIGFGSMDYLDHRLSDSEYIERLLLSLNDALAQTNSFGIWLVSKENKIIYNIYSTLFLRERPVHIHMHIGSLPHELLVSIMQYGTKFILECVKHPKFDEIVKQQSLITLLQSCGLNESHPSFRSIIAIHHGGAGTVARFIRLATAQIVVPFLFDQFTWARCLHANDLAPEPLLAQVLEDHISCQIPIPITTALWKSRIMRAITYTQSSHITTVARETSIKGMLGLHKAATFVSNVIMSSQM
ncbi:unnamed protein product [Umbelopsis sp. WA50703]